MIYQLIYGHRWGGGPYLAVRDGSRPPRPRRYSGATAQGARTQGAGSWAPVEGLVWGVLTAGPRLAITWKT